MQDCVSAIGYPYNIKDIYVVWWWEREWVLGCMGAACKCETVMLGGDIFCLPVEDAVAKPV